MVSFELSSAVLGENLVNNQKCFVAEKGIASTRFRMEYCNRWDESA